MGFYSFQPEIITLSITLKIHLVLLCYVMWNLFTVGSLQFPNDNTVASLEANQNQPKIKKICK